MWWVTHNRARLEPSASHSSCSRRTCMPHTTAVSAVSNINISTGTVPTCKKQEVNRQGDKLLCSGPRYATEYTAPHSYSIHFLEYPAIIRRTYPLVAETIITAPRSKYSVLSPGSLYHVTAANSLPPRRFLFPVGAATAPGAMAAVDGSIRERPTANGGEWSKVSQKLTGRGGREKDATRMR